MTTEFSYEHVFRAPSAQTILEAYFDASHLAAQDVVAGLTDRTVVESVDDDTQRKCVWRVTSQSQLPMFVRPFVKGGKLSFFESMTWRKGDNTVEATVTPDILSGRVSIKSTYKLDEVGDGQVRRRRSGSVTANITLLSGKIERGIIAEFDKGTPAMTKVTQDWLDQQRAV
jgi:hypothetical protein